MDYKASGVDIDAGNEVVRRIRSLARGTYTRGVLSDIGSFGGLFHMAAAQAADPVLVASADGVGTKLRVAFMTGKHDTIGTDLVNHCVNDILVQGAEPLFFLDYLATGRLDPDVAVKIVEGLAAACRENGCALLGGETAEMPGFYKDGEYDVAGFIVGAVPRARLVDGRRIVPGDVLIGLRGRAPGRLVAGAGARDVNRRGAARAAPLVPSGHASAARVRRDQGHGAHHRRRHHRQLAQDPAVRDAGGRRPRVVASAPDLPVAAACG
jgi:AIR synthase related protein